MLRITLVRHAETDWNRVRRIQGSSDTPLNAFGLRQADAAARFLKTSEFSAIYSSPLQRALSTAEAIGCRHGLEPVRVEVLREITYGAWEWLAIEEVISRWPGEWLSFVENPALNRPPGGEPSSLYLSRFSPFLEELHARHSNTAICLVGHSGSIRGLLTAALLAGAETWIRLSTANASVSEVHMDEAGRTEVIRMNDTSFLEGLIRTEAQ